jgi:hypothetical protein
MKISNNRIYHSCEGYFSSVGIKAMDLPVWWWFRAASLA